jgi:hypothetical protein
MFHELIEKDLNSTNSILGMPAPFNFTLPYVINYWHCLLQVNQKMMKSTLIKDLYGEIDRLKAGI